MSYFLRERCAVVALIVSAAVCAGAQNQTPPSRDVAFARISIPRLDQAPTLKDFEGMQPASPLAKHMLVVDKFIGRIPVDDVPSSEPTQAYLGYDSANLYVA
jgi:hypothetical protein